MRGMHQYWYKGAQRRATTVYVLTCPNIHLNSCYYWSGVKLVHPQTSVNNMKLLALCVTALFLLSPPSPVDGAPLQHAGQVSPLQKNVSAPDLHPGRFSKPDVHVTPFTDTLERTRCGFSIVTSLPLTASRRSTC